MPATVCRKGVHGHSSVHPYWFVLDGSRQLISVQWRPLVTVLFITSITSPQ